MAGIVADGGMLDAQERMPSGGINHIASPMATYEGSGGIKAVRCLRMDDHALPPQRSHGHDCAFANRPCASTHAVFNPVGEADCIHAHGLASLQQRNSIMNFIIWLIIGGLIGWVASMVMKTNGQQGVLLNIIVGIVGAFLGGWLISPLVGVSTINQDNFSLAGMAVSFVGAVILLAIVNLFRRGSKR